MREHEEHALLVAARAEELGVLQPVLAEQRRRGARASRAEPASGASRDSDEVIRRLTIPVAQRKGLSPAEAAGGEHGAAERSRRAQRDRWTRRAASRNKGERGELGVFIRRRAAMRDGKTDIGADAARASAPPAASRSAPLGAMDI